MTDEHDDSAAGHHQTATTTPSEAILPFGDRLDEIAQDRFNRTDWIELAAANLDRGCG